MPVFSAVILLAAGAVNLYFEWRKRRLCSLPADAVIAEIKRNQNVCGPVLSYRAGGKPVRADMGVVRNKRADRYRIGQQVKILCNPDKPEEFRIAGKNGVLILSVLLLAAGIGGLVTIFLF